MLLDQLSQSTSHMYRDYQNLGLYQQLIVLCRLPLLSDPAANETPQKLKTIYATWDYLDLALL
jgi:hypothetical protein